MRRVALGVCFTLLMACGGGTDVPPATSLALAPAYDGVVVAKLSPDGIGISGLDAYPIELFDLQAAGGQVVGAVRRPDRGPDYEVQGTFDTTTGAFRFEPFVGTLSSTRTEQVDAIGGRADDDFPRDGLANSLTGFVRTSSAARFETDGDLLAVARADDLPTLDPGTLTAVEVELGKVVVSAAPGFTDGSVGVELFLHSAFEDDPVFRLSQSASDGRLNDTVLAGVSGDILVLRALRAGRRGRPIWLRVTD